MKDVNDISKLLASFVNSSPLNIVPELDNMVIYEEPLVAIASAQDPLFAELKKPDVISPEHYMPEDWLPGA
ncbi:MAG: epoxyqueuosine reductase, partial [Clostridiales bacterium]|nr:epoxyqueuosine reductase [Clostridiales bacterium]